MVIELDRETVREAILDYIIGSVIYDGFDTNNIKVVVTKSGIAKVTVEKKQLTMNMEDEDESKS